MHEIAGRQSILRNSALYRYQGDADSETPRPANPAACRSSPMCRISTTPPAEQQPSIAAGRPFRRAAIASRRGQDRLQAGISAESPRELNARSDRGPAQINSMHQNAGDDAVGSADTVGIAAGRSRQ